MTAAVATRESKTSLIEEREEPAAKALVRQQIKEITGKDFNFRACGYMVALKIHIRPEELKTIETPEGPKTLYLPDTVRDNDKYQSCVALVIDVGPQAYKGKNLDGSDRFPEGPWCKVGDWVVIPRYEAFQINYRKSFALAMLPDDKIVAVVDDPNDITPGTAY